MNTIKTIENSLNQSTPYSQLLLRLRFLCQTRRCLNQTRQRVHKMQSGFQLRIGQHPQQIVQDEHKTRRENAAVGQLLFDRDATTRLIGEQTQWRQGAILRGTGLDANRLPGEFFEDEQVTVNGILETGDAQIGR